MKKIFLTVLAVASLSVFAESEKRVKAELKSALVFLKKAQLTSEVRTEVDGGNTKIIITGVPGNLNPDQIQVKGKGDAIILGIGFRKRPQDNSFKTKDIHLFEDSLEHTGFEVDSLTNLEEVLKGEEQLLYANKEIKSTEKGVKAHDLEDMADLFRDRLSSLRAMILKNNIKKDKLNKKLERLHTKLDNYKRNNGEIVVSIQAENKSPIVLDINYLIENAGWEPLYELKAKTGTSSIQLIYKANVYQNTGANWENIKLTLSSANPLLNGNQPTFSSQYLNFKRENLSEDVSLYEVDQVLEEITSGSPGAAASVNIRGVGSHIGVQPLYIIDGQPESNTNMLNPSDVESMDVVKDEKARSIYGAKGANGVVLITTKSGKYKNLSVMTEPTSQEDRKIISVTYELKNPVSISSNTSKSTFIVKTQAIESTFRHYAYPKLDADAFSNALVTDWEKYNILNGRVSIFSDDEFVTNAYINTKIVSDTLKFPLGRDKKVIVTREKIKDFTSKKFIGLNVRQEYGYSITVRNINKEAINLTLQDQIPVSQDSQIEVEFVNDSNAKYDPITGKLSWDFHIDPTETKKVIFKFAVKYPKDKVVSGL